MSKSKTYKFTAKLQEFFPPDHEDTPCLLRAAIIRDDLRKEVLTIRAAAKRKDPLAWELVYAIRRSSVTLRSARDLIGLIRSRPSSRSPRYSRAFLAEVAKVHELLKKPTLTIDMSDSIGAHVNPTRRSGSGSADRLQLFARTWGDQSISMRLNFDDSSRTSCQDVTSGALAILMPPSREASQVKRFIADVGAEFVQFANATINIIDHLLQCHWLASGGIAPPKGYSIREPARSRK
jgi:hypothetical protein